MTEAASPPDRPGRDALIVVAACLVAYAIALGGGFHYDDQHHVVENRAIRSLENVPRFFEDAGTFSSLPHHKLYRPVLMTSYALDFALWRLNPLGFLITNLLIHVLAALAVLALARSVLGPGRAALLAAVLFGVHPLASEVVSYVSARSSSLATLLAVLAVVAHLRANRASGASGIPWRLLSLALLAGACLTKAIAVTVPILAALATWAADAREGRRRSLVAWTLPLVLMIAVVGVYYVEGVREHVTAVEKSIAGRVTTSTDGDLLSREKRSVVANLATQSRVFWRYLGLVVLPVGLSVDHAVRVSPGFGDPLALAALAAIVALIVAVLVLRARSLRFGVLWFGVALLPTSSVFPLLVVMNEHRLYLPMAGLVLPLGAFLAWAWDRGTLRVPVVTSLVILAVLAVARTRDWRDAMTLWQATVRTSPDSYQAHTNLGIVYYRRAHEGPGRAEKPDPAWLAKALAEYRIAQELYPGWFNVPFNQGLAHRALGLSTGDEAHFDAAEDRFRRCLELSPGSFRARWHLAVVDSDRGRLEKALAAFLAMRAEDDSVTALYHYPIGDLQRRLERYEDAEATYREALEIERRKGEPSLGTRVQIVRAVEGQGRHEDAEGELRALLEEHPRSGPLRIEMAKFLRRTGRGSRAELERLFQEAILLRYRPTPEEQDAILGARAPGARMTPDGSRPPGGGREGSR
jgi:tetratricopeptide (TPR) repeat protein